MRSFKIEKENIKYENMNIYKVISKVYTALSANNLNKVFRLKDVKVNGTRVSKEYIVKKNDEIQVYLSDNILFGNKKQIEYVYEDENILVAFKPEGIESCNMTHKYNTDETCFKYFEDMVQKEKGLDISICHRLDTNTQGLLIFSKNKSAHKEILNAFKNNQISKYYLCAVYSKPKIASGVFNAYLCKNAQKSTVTVSNTKTDGGVKITTEYKLIKYNKEKNYSILEVLLHTGKTHQIRAHLSYLGLPIIGDPKYTTHEINNKYNLNIQALAAYKYTFKFANSSALSYLNKITIQTDVSFNI